MRFLRLLAVAVVTVLPLGALGVDAPHVDFNNCQGCHMGHNSVGGSLTSASGNYNLCQTCHGNRDVFGFLDGWDPATPGSGGQSHRWDTNATNPAVGALPPNNSAMSVRLGSGNLQCSTCHDQHQSDVFALGGRGSQHVKKTPDKPVDLGGSGTITVTSVPPDLPSKGYLIEITTGGNVGTAKFSVSNDNGISWIQENVNSSATVTLNDNVVLAFGGSNFIATEKYKFYVSYPFLRADNTDGAMCVDCHRERNMTYQNVEGTNLTHAGTGQQIVLGTTVFSHPVGQTLDANGEGYDRATILEPNGTTTTDNNDTNNLELSNNKVTCMTCHHLHNADSNSLSEDPR